MWTFKTTDNLRIRFNFQQSNKHGYELFQMGDGVIARTATSLARFDGYLPHDVTSVSSSAWLKTTLRHVLVTKTNTQAIFVTAVEKNG